MLKSTQNQNNTQIRKNIGIKRMSFVSSEKNKENGIILPSLSWLCKAQHQKINDYENVRKSPLKNKVNQIHEYNEFDEYKLFTKTIKKIERSQRENNGNESFGITSNKIISNTTNENESSNLSRNVGYFSMLRVKSGDKVERLSSKSKIEKYFADSSTLIRSKSQSQSKNQSERGRSKRVSSPLHCLNDKILENPTKNTLPQSCEEYMLIRKTSDSGNKNHKEEEEVNTSKTSLVFDMAPSIH